MVRVGKPVLLLPYRGVTDLRRYYEDTTLPSNLVVLGMPASLTASLPVSIADLLITPRVVRRQVMLWSASTQHTGRA